MKTKILITALVASLAFNIAFLSGFLLKRGPSKSPHGQFHSVLDHGLNLNPRQRRQLDYIIHQFRLDLIQFRDDILEKRMDIIEEFSDPEFKVENLEESLAQLNQLQMELNQIFLDNLVKICDELDNQQRLQFLMNLGKNWFFINRSRKDDRDEK